MTRRKRSFAWLLAGMFLFTLQANKDAGACGCFAPPDPSVPIVQAGENIAFEMQDGEVTAHIQVLYSGPAQEFGWLLPLPSEPTMTLGTDELFAQLISTTQPKYRVTRQFDGMCAFGPSRNASAGGDAQSSAPKDEGGEKGPLVIRDTVGPYDFAVLRADAKEPMFNWLTENNFFIPTGTEDVVGPYIKEGAFFLALKLRKGEDTGDLQPVVVKYKSDLPMIPIVLTSVAADPDMGIQVWVLGKHRAIPRNYYHTIINDAKIDWLNSGANYVDVITDAVDEAPEHHSFVTEYAGASDRMKDVLDPQSRFANINELARAQGPVEFVVGVNSGGFPTAGNGFGPPQYSSQLISILQGHVPAPEGVEAADFYSNIGFYQQQYASYLAAIAASFDAAAATAELEERIVKPIREAGEMFRRNGYMTRMFTTLSPEEMSKDPVFSFNADLPDINNEHDATLTYKCGVLPNDRPQGLTPAVLLTEQGWKVSFPKGTDNADTQGGVSSWKDSSPFSLRTEILREEGAPEIFKNNQQELDRLSGRGGGCRLSLGRSGAAGSVLAFCFALGFVFFRRRS